MAHCVAVLSGGLDSMLAIRIMQEQDVEVDALNFKTIFECCQDRAGQAARSLGVSDAVVVMGVAYGYQWTNMIQPFWALPLLAIVGLDARSIMGYCFVIFLTAFVCLGGGLLLIGAG